MSKQIGPNNPANGPRALCIALYLRLSVCLSVCLQWYKNRIMKCLGPQVFFARKFSLLSKLLTELKERFSQHKLLLLLLCGW